jgi:hypothetical protein
MPFWQFIPLSYCLSRRFLGFWYLTDMAEETLAYWSIAKTKASKGRQNQNGKHQSFDIVDMYNEFRCWALSSKLVPELCP